MCTSGSSKHVRTLPDHQHGFFHRPATNTTPSLGLIQLLEERGISALTQPSLTPTHRPSTSTLVALYNKEPDGAHVRKKQQRRNIFSFNLVDKLQNLGLHKVVARGFIDSGKEKRDTHSPPPTKNWTLDFTYCIMYYLLFCMQQIQALYLSLNI